jgi:hypothetical protein
MARESFKENYPPQSHLVGGELLNKHARAQNAIDHGRIGSGAFQQQRTVHAQIPPLGHQTIMGVAVIVDASDDSCGVDSSGDPTAPCGSENRYKCRFRWYEPRSGLWHEYDELINLDASGYWEGLTDGEKAVVGNTFETDASKSPTSGPSYGAIPAFAAGDIVPAYWDIQRGWAVPIVSPPADQPLAEFVSITPTEIDQTSQTASEKLVDAYLEVREPHSNWLVAGKVSIRVPVKDVEGLWAESRTGFAIFGAPMVANSGTEVRLRMVRTVDYEIYVTLARVRLTGLGRRSVNSSISQIALVNFLGGEVASGLSVFGSVPGRYKDSPSFGLESPGNSGIIEIQYADFRDEWIIGADFEIQIANLGQSSSSTSGVAKTCCGQPAWVGVSAITARVGDHPDTVTPGSGSVILYRYEGGAMVPEREDMDDPDSPQVPAVTCYNWSSQETGTDRFVWVEFDEDGICWVTNEDC